MKLARLPYTPSALVDFFQEGLEALGAVCERTWHDQLHLVAEGSAAHLWNAQGALVEKEIRFVAPDDSGVRQADREVFPGSPLTFRLADELRPQPPALDRAVVQPMDLSKPPPPELAEKLWHAQLPGASRWRLEGAFVADWHFSLLALSRCEIQAIDQHWSLHRLAISLPDGRQDPTLAAELEYVRLANSDAGLPWPVLSPAQWSEFLTRAFSDELRPELIEIRERQKRYLRRELERVDRYFEQYENELTERHRRSRVADTRLKAEERLAAARSEHARRRQDQIHRHEIRVLTHLDGLVLLAEPAWRGKVCWTEKGESKSLFAQFVPRSRRWVI
jgi:hypothetical protein